MDIIKPIRMPEEMATFTEEDFKKALDMLHKCRENRLFKLHITADIFKFAKMSEIFQCMVRIEQLRGMHSKLEALAEREEDFLLETIAYFYGDKIRERIERFL